MDGVEPVGGIPVMAAPDPMEQLLALEMIRVTEAAAIESARFMGRGDKDGADAAATEAMRRTMDEIDFAGRIVIGEGERDEAPMLYIGERVGRTGADRDDVPRVDIAVDPLEGTNLVAHGQPGAITVLAASEAGHLGLDERRTVARTTMPATATKPGSRSGRSRSPRRPGYGW